MCTCTCKLYKISLKSMNCKHVILWFVYVVTFKIFSPHIFVFIYHLKITDPVMLFILDYMCQNENIDANAINIDEWKGTKPRVASQKSLKMVNHKVKNFNTNTYMLARLKNAEIS